MATINDTFNIDAAGNITQVGAFVAGTSVRFSTLELHQWLQDLADNPAPDTVNSDLVSILGANPSELAGKRNAVRPMALSLLNGVNIADSVAQWFDFGSIEQANGATLFTGLKVLGSLVANSPIYIYQGTTKLGKYWADADAASFQILVKCKAASTLISTDAVAGRVVVYSRKYGQSYSHFDVDLSPGGEQVAALSTALDGNVDAATMTPTIAAGYFATAIGGTGGVTPKITLAYADTTQNLGGGAGSLLHKGTITLDGTVTLAQAYQALMWACSEASTITFNAVPGWRYRVLPGQTYAENLSAPFGSYAGGKWFVAQGWWLAGVMTADSKAYQLTSHTGVIETPPTSVSISVGGVIAGDYVLAGRDSGTGFVTTDTTLSAAAAAAATSVTLTAAPADTPTASGYIRISGNRHTYTTRAGNTISGLSPAVPTGGYASGTAVWIPFIDVAASATSVPSSAFQFASNITVRFRVRNGTANPIVPFESTLSVTSNGGSGTAVRNLDA
jgi:hypothetical protein